MSTEGYRPREIRIVENKDTKKFLKLEEKRTDFIFKLAHEFLFVAYGKRFEENSPEFWNVGLPQVLFDLLNNHGRHADAAAIAYLKLRGYKVVKLKEDDNGG